MTTLRPGVFILAVLISVGVSEGAASRNSGSKPRASHPTSVKQEHHAVPNPSHANYGMKDVNLHTLYPALSNRSHISSGHYYHNSRYHHSSYGGRGYGSRSRGTNTNVRGFVTKLEQVKRELIAADHDYDGHRVRAVHSVHQAIYQMEPTTAHRNLMNHYQTANARTGMTANLATSPHRANSRGGNHVRSNMPQSMSDSHLRNGLEGLTMIENQMENLGTSNSDAMTIGHVQTAIRELRTALKIR